MLRPILVFIIASLTIVSCSSTSGDSVRPGSSGQSDPTKSGAEQKDIVRFTPAAVVKLRAFRQEGNEYVRVGVHLDDQKQFTYDVAFETIGQSSEDYFSVQDGIKIVVRKDSSHYLIGSTIDWRTHPDGREGFYFENPNALAEPNH